MKILIVCSGNIENFSFEIHQAFIYEQIEEIRKLGWVYDTYFIKGKGIFGYLKNVRRLRKRLKNNEYRFIHAHNVYSGLLSLLTLTIPVIITFHGSDINIFKNRLISQIVSFGTKWRIFVSQQLYNKLYFKPRNNFSIVPCGIELEKFYPIERIVARKKLGLELDCSFVLFSSHFNNPVKNYPLARESINLSKKKLKLIELKDKDRNDVNLLVNACNLLLLTSFTEGSPQIIKEAMACNCPIVATNVGDISDIIKDTEGCYLTYFDAEDVATKIHLAISFNRKTNGRERISDYDNRRIAKKIDAIYKKIANLN